jgi:hypothetical protein
MAYFIGQSGYDGLNPINAIIVVGNSSRQWLQAIEIDKKSKTLGKIKTIIPRGPDDPDSIIDAIIAFTPDYFLKCDSFEQVSKDCQHLSVLDFDLFLDKIPKSWFSLREEAKKIIPSIGVFKAPFTSVIIGDK